MSKLKEKLEIEMRSQVREHDFDPKTYEEYCDLMFMCMTHVGYADGTKKNYKHVNDKYIYPYIQCDALENITSSKLTTVHNRMYGENLTYYYRVIARTILNHIFSFAMTMGRIDENPCEIIKIKE